MSAAAQPDPNVEELMWEDRSPKEMENTLNQTQEQHEEYENRILQMKARVGDAEMQSLLSNASECTKPRKVESPVKETVVATSNCCCQRREQAYNLLVESMSNVTSSLEQALNDSQSDRSSLQEKIQLLEEEKLSLHNAKLSANRKSLWENDQTNSSSSQMLIMYRRDLDEANDERNKLEDIVKTLKQEKLQLKDERDEKRREIEKVSAERDTLKKEVMDLQTETQKISTLQLHLEEDERCIELRDSRISDLEKKLSEATDDIEVQNTAMARLKKKIAAKEVELASLEQLIDDVKKERDSVVVTVSQLQTELDQKSEAFDAGQEQLQRLQTRLTCFEVTTAEIQKVMEDRLRELDSLRREHHMLSTEVVRMQAQETDLRIRLAMGASVMIPDFAMISKLFEEQKEQIVVVVEERNKVDFDNARLKAEIDANKQQFQKLTADKQQAVNDKERFQKKLLSLNTFNVDLSEKYTKGNTHCLELQQKLDVALERNRQLEVKMQIERDEYESTLRERDRLVEQTQLSRNSLARDSRDFYEKEIKAKEDKFNEEHMNQSLMEEQKRNGAETKRMISLQAQEIQRLNEELKAANVSVEAEAERSRTLTAQVEELKEELKVANSDVERQKKKKKTKNIEDGLGFANRHVTELRDEEKLAKEKAEATVALLQGELDKEKEKSKRRAGKSIDSVNGEEIEGDRRMGVGFLLYYLMGHRYGWCSSDTFVVPNSTQLEFLERTDDVHIKKNKECD